MAETALTSLLSKVAELAFQEGQVLLKVGGDIMLLRDRLEWLQAFVRDADRKRRNVSDEFTQVLVRQTRDVAFEAEDTIDEFFHKVDIKSHGDKQGWQILGMYLKGCTTQISVRHGLSGQIKRIISRLDQLTANRKEYTLGTVAPGAWTSSITSVGPWTDISDVRVGLDTMKIFFDQLRHTNCEKLVYYSILGESGIGKTTLMMQARPACKDDFKVFIFHTMPPNSSVESVLRELHTIADQKTQKENKGEDLRGCLAGERYLVVLAGISSKSMLNCLKPSFPEDHNGSRVVLILEPENEEVANHAAVSLNGDYNKSSILKLGRLNETDTGDLLLRIVYGNKKGNTDIEKQLEEGYKRQVYKITGGLPLAVVVLSGLLRSKEMPVEWDAVLQQFVPGGEVHGTEEPLTCKDTPVLLDALLHRLTPKTEPPRLSNRMAIEKIFSASFDDLPHDLKTCFLYFAAFSKNTVLDPGRIVRMWAAEGFIKPEMGKTMEEVGQEYLNELASRCLLKVNKYHLGKKMKSVRVHSRLLRFLQSEAREASFIEVHDNTSVLAPGAVRRLSIQNDQGNSVSFGNRFPKMRSFICRVVAPDMDKKVGISFPYGSKFLRLLSLNGVEIEKLPKEIGDMIHLRYIAVDCRNLKEIHKRIDRLINLQTLDIRKSKVESIAQGFWMIKTLRHVFAKQLALNLPEGESCRLENLQSLHGVKPAGVWIEGKCPLDMMPSLLSLELDLDGFETEAIKKVLQKALKTKLQFLQHLELKGDTIPLEMLLSGVQLRWLETLVIDEKEKVEAGTPYIPEFLPNLAMFTRKIRKDNMEEMLCYLRKKDVWNLVTKVSKRQAS